MKFNVEKIEKPYEYIDITEPTKSNLQDLYSDIGWGVCRTEGYIIACVVLAVLAVLGVLYDINNPRILKGESILFGIGFPLACVGGIVAIVKNKLIKSIQETINNNEEYEILKRDIPDEIIERSLQYRDDEESEFNDMLINNPTPRWARRLKNVYCRVLGISTFTK